MPFLSVIKTFKLAVLKLNEEPASLFPHLFHFADHLNEVTLRILIFHMDSLLASCCSTFNTIVCINQVQPNKKQEEELRIKYS